MSDLIERDKVIEYCLKLIDVERKQGSDVMNYGQERINQTDAIIAFVENLPSARPKGEWISEGRIYPPTNGYHGAVCSICGTESEYLTNFCGECGADMRKDEPQTECDNDCPYRVDGLGCMRLGGCYKESE